jgi:hypothetical protein
LWEEYFIHLDRLRCRFAGSPEDQQSRFLASPQDVKNKSAVYWQGSLGTARRGADASSRKNLSVSTILAILPIPAISLRFCVSFVVKFLPCLPSRASLILVRSRGRRITHAKILSTDSFIRFTHFRNREPRPETQTATSRQHSAGAAY